MNANAAVMGAGVTSNEAFQRALLELDVERRARDAGVKDHPLTSSSVPDSNEREFVTYFSDTLRRRRAQCDEALSKLALDRTATSSKIDVEQTRSSLTSLFNSLEPDLARKKQNHQQDL